MGWGRAGVVAVLLGAAPLVAWLGLGWRSAPKIYRRPEEVPPRPVALILGAGLRADGSPTTVLADRVRAGAALYHLRRVQGLLLSGDGRSSPYYDETEAMRRLALRLGVPPQALQIDPGGLRTLDSCRRAREIFGATAVVVVTQRFHLPRALWLCEAVGLEAVGLAADRSPYGPRRLWWTAREIPASLTALAEGLLLRLGRRDSH